MKKLQFSEQALLNHKNVVDLDEGIFWAYEIEELNFEYCWRAHGKFLASEHIGKDDADKYIVDAELDFIVKPTDVEEDINTDVADDIFCLEWIDYII